MTDSALPRRPSLRACGLLLLIAAALPAVGAWSGCDSTDLPTPADTLAEDIAASVANAVALQTNGALDIAADLALALDEAAPPRATPLVYAGDVTRTYRYDDGALLWRVNADGTRGARQTDFFARIRRSYTVAFFAEDGTPLPTFTAPNDQAATLQATVTSGTSERQLPNGTSRITSMQGTLTVTDLDEPVVTVEGTLTLSGLDRIGRTDDVFVALSYTLTLALEAVGGPTGDRAGWTDAAKGRFTGTYQATYSREANGVLTEELVERAIEVEVDEGSATRALRITLGTEVFRADLETGRLETFAP